MAEPIPVHVFTALAAADGQRVSVYEGNNAIRLARGCFLKIDGATVDDHRRICDAINSVCAEIEATSNYGGGA